MIDQLPVPDVARARLGGAAPAALYVNGSSKLIDAPLVGVLCSRECPGHIILETLDRVPIWVREDRIIVSGFHSPLEQQVFRSLMRREGRAIKVLARTVEGYRPTITELEAIARNRLLLISRFDNIIRRTTRESALSRNRLVAALATELIVPYATPGGALADIAAAFSGSVLTLMSVP